MIIDASVLLSAFFPDESQVQAQQLVREHVAGRISLKAPTLLPYEISNAIWQAERRTRISRIQADGVLKACIGLDIEIIPQAWGVMLSLARRFNCSAYDAAYLSLAQSRGEPLITADERLVRAVRDQLDWVIWIRDYPIR
jgi:predicted nucleic acid-binding protein